ncbi:MAG: propanediol utilization microcompartment protein PduB [Oscillospiraceae bacterium]|jgi:microcompartment protein PduB|nr:propanediol utilization microcompartment protein PduB [Oscillospiraceae bacterium]
MDQNLIEKVLKRVASEMETADAPGHTALAREIGVTEFVGTAIGTTIGLVIASVDPQLMAPMELGRYRSIGLIGGRAALGPYIMAVDDAVKATNTEVISIEGPRDGNGGAGPGAFIIIGADDVSDARRGVETALDALEKYFGDIYVNSAGHLEYQYTARASHCIEKAYGSPLGKAFGLVCAGPAAIGAVLSDVAVKAANVQVVSYTSPNKGTDYNYSNEITLTLTGDSGAVRQAVKASIDVGKKLLGALGEEPKAFATPYI